jgi:hypothetical protein
MNYCLKSASSFLLILLFSCTGEPSGGPVLRIMQDTINLGIVRIRDSVKVNIPIYNIGNDTLHIKKVGVSCGCTSGYSHKKYLPPMDSTLVTIAYSPENDKDSFSKSVIIENNSKEAFKLITIIGVIPR